jgi:hypothetical protein
MNNIEEKEIHASGYTFYLREFVDIEDNTVELTIVSKRKQLYNTTKKGISFVLWAHAPIRRIGLWVSRSGQSLRAPIRHICFYR